MVKFPDGTSANTLDWHWQKVDAHRNAITDYDDSALLQLPRDVRRPADGLPGHLLAADYPT